MLRRLTFTCQVQVDYLPCTEDWASDERLAEHRQAAAIAAIDSINRVLQLHGGELQPQILTEDFPTDIRSEPLRCDCDEEDEST